jgi:5'-deoxynucleotidase YfbR-like HD superfamily hydrolase
MNGSAKLGQKIGSLQLSSGLSEEVFLSRLTIENFHVRRYHTEFVSSEETVGEHTAGVLMFCLIITDGNASRELLVTALLHDFAEYYTGDAPFPAKRDYPELKKLLDRIEGQYLLDIGIVIEEITPEEKVVLKAADMLQLCYKARKEIRMGNQDALYVLDNGLSHLHSLKLPSGVVASRVRSLIGDLTNECNNRSDSSENEPEPETDPSGQN